MRNGGDGKLLPEGRFGHPQAAAMAIRKQIKDSTGGGKPSKESARRVDGNAERPGTHERGIGYQLRLAVSIAEQAADCILLTDPDGRITFVNPEVERVFGFSAAELTGRVLHDTIHHHHPDGRPFLREECPSWRRARAGESARNCEDVYFRRDGSAVFMLCSSAPLAVAGEWRGAVLVMHDVSKRKKAEEELGEQRRLLDLSNDAILVRDSQDRVIYWNRGAEQMYGWPRDQAVGKNVHDLLQTTFPEPVSDMRTILEREHKWEGELIQRRHDGELIKVASRWVLDRGRDGSAVVLEANNDVTERRRAEAALGESEE